MFKHYHRKISSKQIRCQPYLHPSYHKPSIFPDPAPYHRRQKRQNHTTKNQNTSTPHPQHANTDGHQFNITGPQHSAQKETVKHSTCTNDPSCKSKQLPKRKTISTCHPENFQNTGQKTKNDFKMVYRPFRSIRHRGQ